ncbi:tetratricopeptide repeat protein [Streptomyces sp. NPDC002324]
MFRLADYLEQHGRTTRKHLCPPASFWHAAHTHLTHPDDLNNLTHAAEDRHRLHWAHHLRHRAADHGDTGALVSLAAMREKTGDRKGADNLAQQAGERGDTRVLRRLAEAREKAGDREGAENLARKAADRGNTNTLWCLAMMRKEAGDREGAEALCRHAADHGDTHALWRLAEMREKTGDREGADNLAQRAALHGDINALWRLAEIREEAGDREGAEILTRQVANHGATKPLWRQATREDAPQVVAAWSGAGRHADTPMAAVGTCSAHVVGAAVPVAMIRVPNVRWRPPLSSPPTHTETGRAAPAQSFCLKAVDACQREAPSAATPY